MLNYIPAAENFYHLPAGGRSDIHPKYGRTGLGMILRISMHRNVTLIQMGSRQKPSYAVAGIKKTRNAYRHLSKNPVLLRFPSCRNPVIAEQQIWGFRVYIANILLLLLLLTVSQVRCASAPVYSDQLIKFELLTQSIRQQGCQKYLHGRLSAICFPYIQNITQFHRKSQFKLLFF